LTQEEVIRDDNWRIDPDLGSLQKAEANVTRGACATFLKGLLIMISKSADEPHESPSDTLDVGFAKLQADVERDRLALQGDPITNEEEWKDAEVVRIVRMMKARMEDLGIPEESLDGFLSRPPSS
jgi:hypothetical protein